MGNSPNKSITLLAFNLAPGGAEKICVILSNEFIKRGYDTNLWLVNYQENALSKYLSDKVVLTNMDRQRVRQSFWSLLDLLIRKKPKRIIVFHPELAVILIILKRLLFLKTVVIVRSINTLSQAYRLQKSFWGKYVKLGLFKAVLRHSDLIIAQSTGMHNDLIKTLKVRTNKISTVPNPAVINGTSKIDKTDGIKGNEFLFVGRLSPQKGLHNLLKAFALAYNRNPNIHLTIVGEGNEIDGLKSRVKMLNIDSSVKFEGYKPHVIQYYLRAKATLLTSYFEGFPNVLVESIAAGTPVIAFDCPSGPNDIIIPGKNGVLIPHLNIEEFSDAIVALANDKITFNKSEVVESSMRFSVDVIVNQYEKLIQGYCN